MVHLFLIAIGLAADAFAISIAEGIALKKSKVQHLLRVSVTFGAFQGMMPILGWFLGTSMQEAVGTFAPWVAFGLLCGLGLKMIFDGLSGFETRTAFRGRRTLRLIFLGLATSIDAFAVGISLGIIASNIWMAAVTIGLVTAILCAVGVAMGERLNEKVESNAELIGGLILIGIGIRMLLS